MGATAGVSIGFKVAWWSETARPVGASTKHVPLTSVLTPTLTLPRLSCDHSMSTALNCHGIHCFCCEHSVQLSWH